MSHDAEQIAAYADQVLSLRDAHLSDNDLYQSLPLCVIDAVYSIGVVYTGVQHVVERYCQHFDLLKFRTDQHATPSRDAQESISSFCDRLESVGLTAMTTEIFNNRQRTFTRNGILKSEAVYKFATLLQTYGTEYLQDVPAGLENTALEGDIKKIPGQGSGISLKYLWMLTGYDDFIKPDRMILRFLQTVLGRAVSETEAQLLFRNATELLKERYPELSPRVLDHQVWKYQRKQTVRRRSGLSKYRCR